MTYRWRDIAIIGRALGIRSPKHFLRKACKAGIAAVDSLLDQLNAVELELARARLTQIQLETRQANVLWFSYCLKRVVFWGIVLWLITAVAHAGESGRNLTCSGALGGYRGAGGHDLDVLTIGSPEGRLCYIREPAAVAAIDAVCQDKQPCRIRARVTRRDTPNGMPQTYNVMKVYSAIKGK
jgi:hypothetical protein